MSKDCLLYACRNRISYIQFRRFRKCGVRMCTRDVCLFIFYMIILKQRQPAYHERRPAWPYPCTLHRFRLRCRCMRRISASGTSDRISRLVSQERRASMQSQPRLTGRPILQQGWSRPKTWLYSRMSKAAKETCFPSSCFSSSFAAGSHDAAGVDVSSLSSSPGAFHVGFYFHGSCKE